MRLLLRMFLLVDLIDCLQCMFLRKEMNVLRIFKWIFKIFAGSSKIWRSRISFWKFVQICSFSHCEAVMFISLIKCLKFVFLFVSVLILSPCLSLIGAFYAGCAVQPVALKYPNRLVSDINCMHVTRVQYNAMQYETAEFHWRFNHLFVVSPISKCFVVYIVYM